MASRYALRQTSACLTEKQWKIVKKSQMTVKCVPVYDTSDGLSPAETGTHIDWTKLLSWNEYTARRKVCAEPLANPFRPFAVCIIRYNRPSDFRFIVKKLAFLARRRLKVAFCWQYVAKSSHWPTHALTEFCFTIVIVESKKLFCYGFFYFNSQKPCELVCYIF